ncbi:MAG: deoxyuridine 5'-triphosphate nucleotidohydrolase [Dehalococcoidia bacterium]|nr:deoxyuridine 5'-triphosphate nucleotidohydrolase [Dehalococcoidia bacterium]
MTGACLDRESILQLILAKPPLVEGGRDLPAQLQPNGIDLTLQSIQSFTIEPGQLGVSNTARKLAGTQEMRFGTAGYINLAKGAYLITLNEVVSLPLDIMALGKPRSSLLRSGVAIQTAVWDAGYRGRSQALLVVEHPQGFRLARDARVMQMVFYRLERPTAKGYEGAYQGENVKLGT